MFQKEMLKKTTETSYKNLNCTSWAQKKLQRQIKCTLFLHMAGEKAIKIDNAITFTETEKGNYKSLERKLQEYVQDKKDIR